MHRLFTVPLQEDLTEFVYILNHVGVANKVAEQSGHQVLYIQDEAHSKRVLEYYEKWKKGTLSEDVSVDVNQCHQKTNVKKLLWLNIRQSPVTFFCLFACIFIAFISQLGKNLQVVSWLSLSFFLKMDHQILIAPISYTLEHFQVWRFITPIFLHFSIIHLAFNMLWLYEFGCKVEKLGGYFYSIFIFFSAIFSNVFQYLYAPNNNLLFGGFSGVIYGLISFCWFLEVTKSYKFDIPKAVYYFMLAWFFIGFSNLFSFVGLGNIANGSHLAGIISGLLFGLTFFSFRKKFNS